MSEIRPKTTSAPETRVSASYEMKAWKDQSLLYSVPEWLRLLKGPGDALNVGTGERISAVRDRFESKLTHQGIHYEKGGVPRVQDVANPDSPDGRWNPLDFMPRFVFDAAEDAFPVDPAFDGDADFDNNGPAAPDGPPGHHQDGVIGGRQGLSAGFAVSKKGEYTVLTYSFYHAHNKALHYHNGDYSFAQVYLKPGADGKLAPTHLYTSWHHGGVLTPWEDLKKDDSGRPVVGVNRGSHALQPLGRGDDIPKEGLAIRGDGVAELDGQALPHQLSFQAFQGNVNGATRLDALDPQSRPRLEAMRWGDAGLDPLLPEVFEQHAHPYRDALNAFVVRPLGRAEAWMEGKLKGAGSWAQDQLKRLPFLG